MSELSGAVADPFGIVGTVQAKVFHVERAVAEGGFGVVYRAYHEAFRAPVALKCLKVPDTLNQAQRASFLERFRTEAELLFRLSAALPEVVRPLQFGLLENHAFVPFLALEWLEGETLSSFVESRTQAGKPPLSLGQALEMLTPIARTLARAHAFTEKSGEVVTIVHRDLKPENIFLATIDGERVPKILDFGIARVKAETSAIAGRATGADGNAFSPAYAAPEQWHPQGFGASGTWTDVYGLAITLTEALVGRPPVEGDLTAMMGAALAPDWRPTPRNKGARITDDAEKAFERALAVDPKSRTQTVDAFWTQLERAAGRTPSIARKPSVDGSAFASIAPPPDLELGLPEPPRSLPQPAPAPSARVPLPPIDSISRFDDELLAPSLDLQVTRAPRPRPVKSEAAAQQNTGVWSPQFATPEKSLGERLRGPAWLVFLAIAIGAVDFVLRSSGQPIMLGPLRLLYIAGPLGVLGVLFGLYRLVD